ncbi:hypothetical protein DHEL01_v205756 [Diaporthe helianthi]|uniref:DUF6546 domain-containing protein n=1 Tax=Diaporthe helianthi TaxID=158607 RepID=A0A2P5I014_DIAHE|nr:hypothetical protein DHEL01_v205756 [Diaporthe helianthi]
MAPSDAMKSPNLEPQGEAQKMSLGQPKSHDTFHNYPYLPFELRKPIRAFAIDAAVSAYFEGSLGCSRLASVSKEWQGDVEKALFSKIRVDPLDEEEVSDFERYFTDRRKKYLTQFEVAVDDSPETGVWARDTGLLVISQVMEKTGQLFQQLAGWDFTGEGNKQRSLAIMFVSSCSDPHMDRQGLPNDVGPRSLWEPNELSKLTRNGIPTNVALWAIKSEFPSSLDMVTHFDFVADCVPIAAAKRIIQVMPNLKSFDMETCFSIQVEEGWRDLTDFIQQLRVSAPSLRRLRLESRWESIQPVLQNVAPSMVEFANELRELSHSLEHLRISVFRLHEAFFLPFSDRADTDAAASISHRAWPKLEQLFLSSFSELPISGLGRAPLKPVEILLAAAKATLLMPNLKSVTIVTPQRRQLLIVTREKPRVPRVFLRGFSKNDEKAILAAYAHLIGAGAKLVDEHKYPMGMLPYMRIFQVPTERMVGTSHPGNHPAGDEEDVA